MEPERKAAYARLEEAIREVNELGGGEGVLTEWLVVTATHSYDDDGDVLTQIGKLLPGGGGQVPYHHMMGLLDYALTRCRAEVATGEE